MHRRTTGLVLAIALIAGGCAGSPASTAPSPGSPSASVPATTATAPTSPRPTGPTARATVAPPAPDPWTFSPPPATAEPTPPAGLERTATKTRDGIRVTVTLQRNPMPAGERSWVRTTVKNIGDTTATWFHDGCATSVGVGGTMEADWRSGTSHEGQAQAFKDAVLGKDYGELAYDSPWLQFVPKDALSRGSYGCADIGLSEKLRPGETIKATRWWSGLDPTTKAPPPGGPVTLDIWSGYFWRGKEPESIPDQRIRFTLDAWVTGGWSAQRPSPGEIVDAALSDAAFVAYLDTQELYNGRDTLLWYDAAHDRWEVGVLPWNETEPPRIHGVLVDAATGRVIGPLDREWDHDVDGFPF